MDEIDPEFEEKYSALFARLVNYGKRRGKSREAAEDLAQDTILRALRHYVPERGELENYCMRILRNLITDSWGDFLLVELVFEPADVNENPFERRNLDNNMGEFIRQLNDNLDPELKAFLSQVREVCSERDKVVISEAARRLGLSAEEGWNRWRRIQTAAQHVPGMLTSEVQEQVRSMPMMRLHYPEKTVEYSRHPDTLYSAAMKFLESLTTEQKAKLASFIS